MWVNLQIKEICDSDRFHTEADLLEELGRLPVGLEETYDQIFKIISSYPRQASLLATRTLQWIMCATYPLSPDLLSGAISIPLSGDGDVLDGLKMTRDKILQLCHNLVIWDEQLDVMRFAHLSVFEFLEKKHWSVSSCHSLVAEACLQVICLPNSESMFGKEFDPLSPLGRYCYERCFLHLSPCDRQHARYPQILTLQQQLCRPTPGPSKALRVLIEVGIKIGNPFLSGYGTVTVQWVSPIRTPLCFAVAHRLIETVQYVLGLQMVSVNEVANENGWTPLFYAARNDDTEEICRLLLQSGADPNIRDTDGETPLLRACRFTKSTIVKLLLNHGADIEAKDNGGYSTLDMARENKDKTVLQAIIKHMESLGKVIPPGHLQGTV